MRILQRLGRNGRAFAIRAAERRGSDAAVSIKQLQRVSRVVATMVAVSATLSSPWRRCGLPSWCVSSEVELRRDEKRVSSRITRNAMTLAMSALLFGAVNASAQSDVVLQASNPSARAGRWAVVSDSGAAGGAKIRHADAGRGQDRHGCCQPCQLLRAHVLGHEPAFRTACGCTAGRRRRLGQRFGIRAVRRQRQLVGRRGLPHRDDVGDRGQSRALQGLRPRAAGRGRTTAGATGVLGPGHLFRDDRHTADARADARRRAVDRSGSSCRRRST